MTTKQKTSYYNNFMNTLVKKAKKEKTDAGKIRILYDGIASQSSFDKETHSKVKVNKESYTAKGAIVNGTAVSKGYALALADALKKTGFTSVIQSVSSKDIYWNKVKLGKSWYNIDVASGDSDDNNYPFYAFFLRDDVKMESTGYKSPAKYKATNLKYSKLASLGDALLFRDSTGFYFMHQDEGIYRYDYNGKKKTYQKFTKPTNILNEGHGNVYYFEVIGKIPEGMNSNKVLKNVVVTPFNNLKKKTILFQTKNAVYIELLKDKVKVTETFYNDDDDIVNTKYHYFNY